MSRSKITLQTEDQKESYGPCLQLETKVHLWIQCYFVSDSDIQVFKFAISAEIVYNYQILKR